MGDEYGKNTVAFTKPEKANTDGIYDPDEWTRRVTELPAGVAGMAGSVGFMGCGVADQLHEWFTRFVNPLDTLDLALLTLWSLHTHFIAESYTTPRLALDSPVPGAGKTTVLEHLNRLCLHPLQVASLSTPSMLTRLIDADMRTILLDEVDRNLRPDREGVGDLLAVLNTGYKRGGIRPTNVPDGNGGWIVREFSTYAPVAMAGVAPLLPDDTRARTLTVVMLPDDTGQIEDTDWEALDPEVTRLAEAVSAWADDVRAEFKVDVLLPPGCKGRQKEVWRPLLRTARLAGGDWPGVAALLVERDLAEIQHDREEGLMGERPAVMLLHDIADLWPRGAAFWASEDLVTTLARVRPERWGEQSAYGKTLTAQRVGNMLGKGMRIRSQRRQEGGRTASGYTVGAFSQSWRRLGIHPPEGVSPQPQ